MPMGVFIVYFMISITVSEVRGTLYKVQTNNIYVLADSEVPSVTERALCALMCHQANCEAFVVDANDHVCKFMQRNSNPYENLYLSGDIGMCHSLPAGTPSAVYTITTSDSIKTDVFCDMDTLGGRWTVIQNRFDGSQDFYNTWEEYKHGFGFPFSEYWIGNENLYRLTSSGSFELRIEMEDAAGLSKYAAYTFFSVASESDNYTLTVSGFTGNVVYDAMAYHNLKPFTTKDHDNDAMVDNCADKYHGGWWYRNCHNANLNGPYRPSADSDSDAMAWYRFEAVRFEALQASKMMIRHTGL